jgi:S-adenosylmethionine decarboxylase
VAVTELERVDRNDFVGRHLIVDASTYTRRNLASTDAVFALFEALNRNLDMTAVLPPIVCRYPFANDELTTFCDDIETELEAKAQELARTANRPVDLSLGPVRVMREALRRRQIEESGVTGVNIWSESHAAIHTWDEDNYFAFDAFSCRDFEPKDALRLLLTYFDVETLNCVNVFRYQRALPRIANFQVNGRWEVVVDGRVVGELDSVAFSSIDRGALTPEPPAVSGTDGATLAGAALTAGDSPAPAPAGRDGRRGRPAAPPRRPRGASRTRPRSG